MCLSTSSAFVCWVKLFVRTTLLAFASASSGSLSDTVQASQTRTCSNANVTHSSSSLSCVDAPGLSPYASSSPSFGRFRFFLISPFVSFATSIPFRDFLSLRSSIRSEMLWSSPCEHQPRSEPELHASTYSNVSSSCSCSLGSSAAEDSSSA